MAFFCEQETVLRMLRDGADMYYQQSKYSLGETVRNHSPPSEGKLKRSTSLEKLSALLSGDSTNNGSTTTKLNVDKQAIGPNNKCNVVKFNDASSSFVFQKCPIVEPATTSELSNNIVRIKFIQFKVYFPKECDPFFVQVSLPEIATAEAILKQALSAYNELAEIKLPLDIDVYKFYMAEKDGTPDEFGILGRAQIAAKMGNEFAIVPNRDAGVGRTASVARSNLPSALVIWLPSEKVKTTVSTSKDMLKISDLIKKVCDKRNMNPADFHVAAGGVVLPSNMPVQNINPADSIELRPNVALGSEEDEPEITTFHDTFKYKAFEVQYNKKKGFSMGIDGEYIQIFKKKSGFAGFAKEKKELHAFSDLTFIAVGKGSKAFSITWKDGKQEMFESNQRKEIMSKIEAIQQRKRDGYD
mmetsp:Transcript_11178/g.19068  ORF Transcript_11178/g.19068 Transcript_11178/m.19068 type:complete len:414 (+) Transcript_11178:38-1279(+)